ncbi:MAG TPA: hypothetical protein VMU28_14765 [Terriglobales bacterium]|nr:hypothetical protein [Terriglobales bacterium]
MTREAKSRWLDRVTGVALVGFAFVALVQPAPKVTIHCLESAAVHRLAPVVRKSAIGRQLLSVYCGNQQCSRTI